MYRKFTFMLIASFFIMYSMMFINVTSLDHIYLSINRFYMALLMVSPMALLMLLFMRNMYKNKSLNRIIGIASIIVFISALTGLRTQAFISDEQYMKGMIPHHSSAIMTSSHANLQDPEVQKLAAGIIKSQEKEIREMKSIVERMNQK